MKGKCRCLYNLAKYGPCLAACREVLSYYPLDPVANLLKGECLLVIRDTKNYEAAIRAFQQGLKGAPNSTSLNKALNKVLNDQKSDFLHFTNLIVEVVNVFCPGEMQSSNFQSQQLTSGMRKFCGASSDVSDEAKLKKCNQAKFANLKEDFKSRIDKHVKMVAEGSKTNHSFAACNLRDLEYQYIKCAAEDAALDCKESGAGRDSALSVLPKK